MKTDVWLDTSALIDLEFRSARLRKHILALFPGGSVRTTSAYVLFELARSYLEHLLLLHNKAADLDTFADLLQYSTNCLFGRPRRGQTMHRTVEDFERYVQAEALPLNPQEKLAQFRAWLSTVIRRGWSKSRRMAPHNIIQCRGDLPPPSPVRIGPPGSTREHYRHALPATLCGQSGNCGLIASMKADAASFTAIATRLASLTDPDDETTSRITALRALMAADPSRPFAASDCYASGDAIIASEAPAGHTVLSKNGKHFAPLCDALRKPRQFYTEPAPQVSAGP